MNNITSQKGSPINIEISVSKAFMAEALHIDFDRKYYFDPMCRHAVDLNCQQYMDDTYPALDALYTESNLGRKVHYSKNQVLVGGIQPNMIIGMLLGADFVPTAKGDSDISPACWAGKNVEDLPVPTALLDHPLVRMFDSQISSVLMNADMMPIPPFFWDSSGRAAIHGPLTTAQKFIGEQVFMDMLTDPDRVRRLMEWIVDANIVLVKHFAELSNIKIHSVHVGECSSCMISPDDWGSFVAPMLERLGDNLGPVRLHSCGQSNHILEAARKVRKICSIDIGGETSLSMARDIFGGSFEISIAPPVKLLARGTLGELCEWSDMVLEANQSGNLTILYHLEPQYSLPILQKWHAYMMKEITDYD